MNISLRLTRPADSLTSDSLPLRKEQILVADDNAVSQQFTVANLRKLGYHADVVPNGIEALNALKIKQYHVILMDCEMPELDGYETTAEIRRQEKNGRHTWIIAMTAYAAVGDRERCLKAGMDDYLSKPLRHEELRTALQRGIARPRNPS